MRTIYVSPDFPLNRRMRKDIRRGKLQVVREGGERLTMGGGIPSGTGRAFRTFSSPLVCMVDNGAEIGVSVYSPMPYPNNGHVCEKCCCDEEDIKQFVLTHRENHQQCSYCGRSGAAPLEDVFAMMLERAKEEWCTPEESGLPMEVIKDESFPGLDCHEGLAVKLALNETNSDFVSHFDQYVEILVWIKKHPYDVSALDALRFGWEGFCRVVKHQRRFFFSDDDDPTDHPNEIPLSNVLLAVCNAAQKAGLYDSLPAGHKVYRVRTGEHRNREDLTAPPPEKARFANRMSPAGIPLFYGSFDAETALAEVYNPAQSKWGDAFTVAEFVLTESVPVLDLSRLPEVPSLFGPEWRKRSSVAFIRGFAKNIGERVEKDGREHIEYVPTQIFAEYLMTASGQENGPPKIGGIVFSSAVNDGGKSCVLFPHSNSGWWDKDRQENLRLEKVSWRKLNAKWDEMKSAS